MKLTFNKIASMIAKKEGKKSQSNIGDIREALKITLDYFADLDLYTVAEIISNHKKKRGSK